MSSNIPTFEEVDKHIQSADLSKIQAAVKSGAAAGGTAAAIPNVCGAYQVVKPILLLLAGLPLIPKKWKDAIKAFMGVLDALCP